MTAKNVMGSVSKAVSAASRPVAIRVNERQLLLVALPLVALPGCTIGIGFPVFTAVASGQSTELKYVGAIVTIGLALLAIHGLLKLVDLEEDIVDFGSRIPSSPARRPGLHQRAGHQVRHGG